MVTSVVSARVLYGFWRSWTVAQAGVHGTAMMVAFGIPESLAAGGIVIGYYTAYAFGVRRRILAWQKPRVARDVSQRLASWKAIARSVRQDSAG